MLMSIIPHPHSDFWGYFQPIYEYMPKNCSSDVVAVIEHVDSILTSNDKTAINQLLSVWNFTLLANHLDDAAGARKSFTPRASNLTAEIDRACQRCSAQPTLGVAGSQPRLRLRHLQRLL